MRQPAQPIPLVALLLWHDGNYLHIVVGVKDSQLHDQELKLFQDQIARTNIADRPMAEISHDRKVGNFLMPSVESIALLFQRIFLAAPLFLTICQLIRGWHLAKSQAIVKKVKVQRCLLVDAVAVVCHQTRQFINVWKMVEHAITLLTF